MKKQKRPHLPRGLRWKSDSRHIWFTWRDSRGKQHQQSTGTDDPATAFGFRQQFLEKSKEEVEEIKAQSAEIGKWPLKRVAAEYFNWKMANSSAATVAREKRIFKPVEKFFASDFRVNAITLAHLREYQKQRRKHVSPTMRQPVTGRTVNYELFLLRCVMTYAGCWNENLTTGYQPLREIKQRAAKVASKDQIKTLITTALANEYWQLAMYCAAVAIGTGCRGGEIRNLQLKDINLEEGKVRIVREIAKNRKEREPRLMALAEWGLRNLLIRAHALGATEPQHYLLPLRLVKSNSPRDPNRKFDVNRPMTRWVRGWRKLTEKCGMTGFRFHDLRHTFRTLGAEAGVPLEVMMAQLGHMDRDTSLEYVHVQNRALERAKQLIESEQQEILLVAHERSPQQNVTTASKGLIQPADPVPRQ
jgi:integrase